MAVERKLACPKCGAENLRWRSRCASCDAELHPDEGKIPGFESRGATFWVPFLLGLVGVGFFGGLAYVGMADDPHEVIFLWLIAVPILGLALAWKWPLAAGILLIIGGVLPHLGVLSLPGARHDPFLAIVLGLAALFISAPLIISGIIFVANR